MDSINEIVKRLREGRISEARLNYAEMDHIELIRLTQEGDQKAFEELLLQYEPLLHSIASKYIIDSGDEDDLMQVASLAFWDAINSYEIKEKNNNFIPHARTIITRKLTDMLRKDSTEKAKFNSSASSLDEPVYGDEDGESSMGDTVSAPGVSLEDEVFGKEGARAIMKFMREKLSPKELTVIKKYISGAKIDQIMEETGMSYKAVQNTLMRVKNKVADYVRATYNEARVRRTGDVKFSEEEKKALASIINKMELQESIKESMRAVDGDKKRLDK